MNASSLPVNPDGTASRVLPYFQSLTLLRGVAALGVCGYHLTVAYRAGDAHPPPLLALALPLLSQGWFGVDLFFLISGYGLAAKLADRKIQGPRAAAAFAVNRFWRIFPLYWFCTGFVLLLALAAMRFNHTEPGSILPSTREGWYATALLVGPLVRSEPVIPVVSWALSLELAVYAVATVAIVARRWMRDVALLGAATLLALANLAGWRPEFPVLFTHWPEFVGGALLLATLRGRWQGGREFWLSAALLTGLVVVSLLIGPPRVAATLLVAIVLILAWGWDGRITGQPGFRWLLWCGRVSFPFFLLHVPVTMRLTNLAARWIPRESFGFVGVLLAAGGTALACAWAIHRWIEVPCLALARTQAASLQRTA